METTKGNALIITMGYLAENTAKTAHGLIRESQRFRITGIIDDKFYGQDAGQVLDGINRNIPIYQDLDEAIEATNQPIQYGIIGIATHGGILPVSLLEVIRAFLKRGISIVNGLHDLISNKSDLVQLAIKNNARIIDIRKPKEFIELHFWSGKIKEVKTPKVAILGTDCAIGKRTTATMLTKKLVKQNIKATMIYTGQTGWLQGHPYGFILDATPNDFVSGEIEHAIYTCYKELNPNIIFVEGQSALRNPSGPCGSELLISGKMDGVVLQHHPTKKYFDNEFELGEIPNLADEVDLISKYGAKTMAITLNTEGLTDAESRSEQLRIKEELKIPVFLPLEDGLEELTNLLKTKFDL